MDQSLRIFAYVSKALTQSLLFLAGFAIVCSAHAYTTSTCQETWYGPAKGKEFTGSIHSWTKVKEQPCKSQSVKVLKFAGQTQDDYSDISGATDAEGFATVNGGGYLVHFRNVSQGPYCGGGDVPGFDPECLLPQWLRHYEIHRERDYYQITPDRELSLMDNEKPGLCGGRYATDGQHAYLISHAFDDESGNFPYTPVRIENADIATFRCFVPEGDRDSVAYEWSLDKNHIFLFGRAIKQMSPEFPVHLFVDQLASIDRLAINGQRVFRIDFDRAELMSGIGPNIRILSKAFVTDGKTVFDRNFRKLDGVSGDKFRVVMPVCPVPGNPELACETYSRHETDATIEVTGGGIGVQSGTIVLPANDSPSRVVINGANSENINYFIVSNYPGAVYRTAPFMLFNGKLYNLLALASKDISDGVSIHGSLKSAKCGYVIDDTGAINLLDLRRVAREKVPDFC
ncbi:MULTISPECIES: DKNYY domain-containing protein [unclassified Paraburkholderia]|uniref:DKNYY domain-containing protein n=1 Tax=unclassified Paraburkholderia TaxID=2615204 RepID=UPI002AB0B59D|nr:MULTISPECIES: hypothetical protein [unclassified Paraburkholderia]